LAEQSTGILGAGETVGVTAATGEPQITLVGVVHGADVDMGARPI
jgi:hypothetical protein